MDSFREMPEFSGISNSLFLAPDSRGRFTTL
jgi:hypothetical protein